MPAAPFLDSHALLALLRDEVGSEMVANIFAKASRRDQPVNMTEVNYAKAQNTIRRQDVGAALATIAGELEAAPIEFHPADRQPADTAADLKVRFKISIADAFAAALAKEKKAELVTGDPEFKALEQDIGIH